MIHLIPSKTNGPLLSVYNALTVSGEMLTLAAVRHVAALDGGDDAQIVANEVLTLTAVECVVVQDGVDDA